ncbi:MAG: FkbM family methyltransferase [Pseudomonadota bacterium]
MRKWLAKLRERAEARGLAVRPMTSNQDGRYAGFSLSWGHGAAKQLRGLIAEITDERGTVRMLVTNERDIIQKEHAQGRFYEREELDLIARYFTGGTYVDVGANVGNHAAYLGKLLGAERMHLFEPNPDAFRLLEVNIALNNLTSVTQLYRLALSDAAGEAAMVHMTNNLGAARIAPEGDGEGAMVSLARGDDVLGGERVDFIKIDVEGHELAVLRGLERVLREQSPTLFVEVEDHNCAELDVLMHASNYRVAEQIQRYPGRRNFLCVPSEKP